MSPLLKVIGLTQEQHYLVISGSTQQASNTAKMTDYFPFELSPFQTEAIAAIKRSEHCLVTAHTGSGKTVPAEFAIQHFTALGKRVIYTSPIKALSNQKLHDFREKYPHITFGIVTGDIEDNKEAQVLIMTTEILSNSLLNRTLQKGEPEEAVPSASPASSLRFAMDYDNDLAAVVFDEVHYISDSARGQAWEQSMMLLPKHVVFVMLSATIANPFVLVNWVEHVTGKSVCLASTKERVVPLKHYVYTPSIPEKKLRSMTPDAQSKVRELCNKLTLVKEGEGPTFKQEVYSSVYNTFKRHMADYEPTTTIPDLVKKLRANEMLPVLIFVFSRHETMLLAEKLCCSGIPPLFSKDDCVWKDINGRIERECRHLLSKKVPNYEDFLESYELRHLLQCVSKGVAYHHAGMMPILRELVEFLDAKGFIKVLFATETFAVGVNMPTRAVVFTSLSKYTEEGERTIMAHEYTQMAGRAGRRGLDTVGHCIILSPEYAAPGTMASILAGKPVSITSNYRISYHLVLGCLLAGPNQDSGLEGSTMTRETLVEKATRYSHDSLSAPSQATYIDNLRGELAEAKTELGKVIQQATCVKTPQDIMDKYKSLNAKLSSGMLTSKMTKACTRDVYKLCQDNFYLERDYEIMKKQWKCEAAVEDKERDIGYAETYVMDEVRAAVRCLESLGFIYENDEGHMVATDMGKFAMSVYEAHPLGLPMALKDRIRTCAEGSGNNDKTKDATSLAAFLSVFCDVKSDKWNKPCVTEEARSVVDDVEIEYANAYDAEREACGNGQFYITREHTVQGVLYGFVADWCAAETNEQCREIINNAYGYANLSTGDFIKAIMKIVKLSKEIASGAEATGNLRLVAVCDEVPRLLLKYLVTSQSLYV